MGEVGLTESNGNKGHQKVDKPVLELKYVGQLRKQRTKLLAHT